MADGPGLAGQRDAVEGRDIAETLVQAGDLEHVFVV
jgi:hypothetical protein